MATRLLCGILFAFALLFLCQGSPAARALHAYSVDDHSLLENGTLLLDPREDDRAENLLHSLSRRANARNMAEAIEKAEKKLLCHFGADDEPEQSNWTEDDLHKWYSQVDYYSEDQHIDMPPDGISFSGKTLSREMEALSLPIKIGDRGLQKFHWKQDQDYEFEGDRYRPSNGYYKGTMSVERGFISAEDNKNPKQYENDPHPDLFRQSDVYILEWQRQAAGKKKLLRYFLRYHVVNEDTLNIIREVTNGATLEWPGTEYTIFKRVRGQVQTTDEGKALLGSPNGMSVGHFLLTNKKVLGKRIPDTVRIWKTQEGVKEDITWTHMLFHIVDYKRA